MVASGYLPPYPVTVYTVDGDDTSGIAGMLFPSGEFIPVPGPRRHDVWAWDEHLGRRVNLGRAVWTGSVAGSINPNGRDGDKEGPINRREWDASLGGDWVTTGELWRAMERGTGMRRGQTVGRVHTVVAEDDGWRAAA